MLKIGDRVKIKSKTLGDSLKVFTEKFKVFNVEFNKETTILKVQDFPINEKLGYWVAYRGVGGLFMESDLIKLPDNTFETEE